MRKAYVFMVLMLIVPFALFASGGQEAEAEVSADGVKQYTDKDMTVSWSVEGETAEFTMEAPTTGWVSIGFNPSRAMKDAQFIIGYVENGTVFVRDDYGTGLFKHDADTNIGGADDLSNVSGEETEGKTRISFSFPLVSGDEYDADLIEGESFKLLLAYGPDGSDNYSSKHSARASAELQL